MKVALGLLLAVLAACGGAAPSSLFPSAVTTQPSDPRVERDTPYDDSPVSPCSGACRETVATGLINPGALVAFGSQVAVVGNRHLSLVSKRGGPIKHLHTADLLNNSSLRYQAGELTFVEFRDQALDHPEPRAISLTGGQTTWLFDDARWPFVSGPAATLAPNRYEPFAFINGNGQFKTALSEGLGIPLIQRREGPTENWSTVTGTTPAPFMLIAIDSTHLYFVDGASDGLFALPTQGGTAQKLSAEPFMARRLVRFDDTVAWLSIDHPRRGDYRVESADLKSAHFSQSLVALHSEQWPDALTVAGQWLVWRDSQGIARMPRAGGALERLVEVNDAAELVVDGGWLYFTRNSAYATKGIHSDAPGTLERVRWQP